MATNNNIYVINEQSHKIYYARGINMDGVMYYANDEKEDVALIETGVFVALDGEVLVFASTEKKIKEIVSEEAIYFGNVAEKHYTSVSNVPWNGSAEQITKVKFENMIYPGSTANWFYGCINLTEIEKIYNLKTRNTTSMACMFKECNNLTQLDVSGFYTSNVMDMYDMFSGCQKVASLDVSKFDTSNVTNWEDMFISVPTTIKTNSATAEWLKEKFPDIITDDNIELVS